MKKVIKSIIIVLGFLFLIGNLTFAVSIENPLKYDTIPEIIKAICDFIFWIGLAIVPLMIIIGGIMFLTAGGEPSKVSKAKNLLLWSAVGFAVLLSARAISSIIETVIGV